MEFKGLKSLAARVRQLGKRIVTIAFVLHETRSSVAATTDPQSQFQWNPDAPEFVPQADWQERYEFQGDLREQGSNVGQDANFSSELLPDGEVDSNCEQTHANLELVSSIPEQKKNNHSKPTICPTEQGASRLDQAQKDSERCRYQCKTSIYPNQVVPEGLQSIGPEREMDSLVRFGAASMSTDGPGQASEEGDTDSPKQEGDDTTQESASDKQVSANNEQASLAKKKKRRKAHKQVADNREHVCGTDNQVSATDEQGRETPQVGGELTQMAQAIQRSDYVRVAEMVQRKSSMRGSFGAIVPHFLETLKGEVRETILAATDKERKEQLELRTLQDLNARASACAADPSRRSDGADLMREIEDKLALVSQRMQEATEQKAQAAQRLLISARLVKAVHDGDIQGAAELAQKWLER